MRSPESLPVRLARPNGTVTVTVLHNRFQRAHGLLLPSPIFTSRTHVVLDPRRSEVDVVVSDEEKKEGQLKPNPGALCPP
jgi:hypothetical protein